jgi:hypothetical protein
MARPSEYDFDMCIEICAEVAEGFNIKTVLKSKLEYPTFQTFCNWKRENVELFDLYVKTMQDKSESEMEEIDRVYDMLKNGEIEPSVANVLIQTNKWKAAKFYPKMFGDKTDLTTNGESLNNSKTIPIVMSDGRTYEDLKNDLKPE